jgi:hypothetical protein
MLLALVAYYIVDGNTAGVIVFTFVFFHFGSYIVLMYPSLRPVGLVSQITLVLIIGYTLQVRKLGVQEATSNGQAYYELWTLGFIRLATVVGGLFVAWIFTVFPYPITEHSQLRRNLGASMYLVAKYYSIVHETVQVRLAAAEGDMDEKTSPGRRLEKVRQKTFSKCNTMLESLRSQSAFIKYDIPIGGRFPSEKYAQVIADLRSVLNYMSLVSVASSAFTDLHTTNSDASGSEWLRNFQRIISEAKLASQSVTTMLTLLSSAITDGRPLPPYVRMPEPYMLTDRLDQIDNDILSVRHVAEPGYASFAVIQIGTKCLVEDLSRLLQGVKELVGEMDFSYHIMKSTNPSRAASSEALFTVTRPNDKQQRKEE